MTILHTCPITVYINSFPDYDYNIIQFSQNVEICCHFSKYLLFCIVNHCRLAGYESLPIAIHVHLWYTLICFQVVQTQHTPGLLIVKYIIYVATVAIAFQTLQLVLILSNIFLFVQLKQRPTFNYERPLANNVLLAYHVKTC